MPTDLMAASTAEWLRFALGLLAVAGLFALTAQWRRRVQVSAFAEACIETRMQYAASGVLLGLLAVPPAREAFGQLVPVAITFFAGWYGLAVGCGVDLRRFRGRTWTWLQTQLWQAAFTVALIALGAYLVKVVLDGDNGQYRWSELHLVLAICIVGGVWRRLELNQPRQVSGALPTLSILSLAAIALAGLAGTAMSPGSFSVEYPFADGRDLLIDGYFDEGLFAVALGVAGGVAGNLACKDVKTQMLFYPLAALVLLACGIANGLGLEPLWVGVVLGIWMINASLRRVDLIHTLELGRSHLPLGLLFLAGWLAGEGISLAFRWDLFLWVVAFLILLRPLARLLSLRLLALWGTGGLGKRPRFLAGVPDAEQAGGERGQFDLFHVEDLALVIAVSGSRLMDPGPGTAVLVGTLVGYGVARAAAGAVNALLGRFVPSGAAH